MVHFIPLINSLIQHFLSVREGADIAPSAGDAAVNKSGRFLTIMKLMF